MSIKIEMDMPKSCDECPFGRHTGVVDDWYIYACLILNNPVMVNIDVCKRFKNCPLKEIK